MTIAGCHDRHGHVLIKTVGLKHLLIRGRMRLALRRPLSQMLKFYLKDGRLQRIQPTVYPD